MSQSDEIGKAATMHLYWCETGDHDEDWFIVAASAEEASYIHEEEEGYGPGDAIATFVCAIPAQLTPQPGWPDHALLEALGAKLLDRMTPWVVELDGALYQEGGMDEVVNRVHDDRAEAHGQGRPNGTTKLM